MKRFLLLSLVLSCSSSVVLALSQDAQVPESLDLSVTATRIESPVNKVPRSIKIIKSRDLVEKEQATSIPEALSHQSGVLLQKTARGQGSPFIRGFTGFRNLFLIDGIRFNNSVLRDGPNQYWNTVDVYSIDRLEVVKGSTSVLYGSDAVGGTINALTRDLLAEYSDDPVSARFIYRYASAEDARIRRGEVMARAGRDFAVLLGGTQKSYGDLRAGASTGLLPKTSYDEHSFDIKMQGRVTPKDELKLAWQRASQDDVMRTHATKFAKSYRGTKVGTDLERSLDQNRELVYLKHKHIFETGFFTNIESALSYQRNEETETRTRSTLVSEKPSFEVHTPGFTVQAQSDLESGLWIYGLDIYRDFVDSSRLNYKADGSLDSRSIQGPVGDDASYESIGAFVQNQYQLSKSLEVTAGLRHSRMRADINRYEDPATKKEADLDKVFAATVGSLRGSYDLREGDSSKLFFGVGQSFRAPNLSDLTRFDLARSSEVEIPSPNVQPERYLSYEVGSRWGDSRNWQVEGWVFRTQIENMIIKSQTGEKTPDGKRFYVTKKNSGKGYVQGAEVDGFYRINPQYLVGGNYTFQWGELESYPTTSSEKKLEPLSRVMPATLNLNARYEGANDPYWAEVIYTLVRKQDRINSGDRLDNERIPPGGSPGYKTYGLRAGGILFADTRIGLAWENILDEDYRVIGSGINEPGRNFVVTLDARF